MNPLSLTLIGFKGIKAGLNRDQVTINLDVEGELIAIIGPNGAGKTTVLDNLHPFRVLPSRASSYTPGGTSYYDHTFGNAQKVLRWEHEGKIYETNIIIKGGGKTPKQECYLHQVVNEINGGEGLRAVSLPDGTTSDGKGQTYDKIIEHIVGTPDMYFTAAFACQGRRTLADYTNGDIKGLMSELLSLDSILELSGQANDQAKTLRAQLEALRGRVARETEIESERGSVALDMSEAEGALSALQDAQAYAKTALASVQRRLAEAQAGAADHAATERRRDTLRSQIETVMVRETNVIDEIIADYTKRGLEAAEIKQAALTQEQRTRKAIADTSARIAAAEALLTNRAEIEAAPVRVLDLDVAVLNAEGLVEAAEKDMVAHRARVTAADQADAAVKLVSQEGHALKATCEDLRRRAGLADDVPCHGTDLQGRCSLLADTMAAKGTLEAKDVELTAKRADHAAAIEKAKLAREACDATPPPDLDAPKAKLKTLQTAASEARALAAKLPAITAAAFQVEGDRASLAELETSLIDTTWGLGVANERITTLAAEKDARITAVRERTAGEKATIQKELDALPPTDTSGLQKVMEELATTEKAAAEVDNAITIETARIATFTERMRQLQRESDELQADVRRSAALADDIAQWTLLAKALGNDGIVALCIDDAGPTLTSIANDLLAACYGPRFTVAIKTQDETKAGTMKEVFDIIVYDADRGDEKSIRDVSGGERVYLNEAMTRAIALYQAEASGRHYGCLFSDESDGALDREKKRQYARMKRKVLEIGGYTRELFISHSAEVQESADAVIDVGALKAA